MDNIGKIVYILGAGCSKEDGAPLINEFFDKAFELADNSGDLSPSQKEIFNRVKEFRKDKLPSSNVEELLSYIDLEKVLLTSGSRSEMNKLYANLTYVIAKTIQISLGFGPSDIFGNFYKNWLLENKNDVSVISFNWDIIADNYMSGVQQPKYHGRPFWMEIDYGSDFECINPDFESPFERGGLNLYKLHGSMNWLYCKHCKKKYFALGQKIIMKYLEGGINCPKCTRKEGVEGIVIPPTFNKIGEDSTIPLITDVWRGAFKSIKEADKIVIIGYSFPEDDVHFKMFFRRALYENYKLKNTPIEIEIVNFKKYLPEKVEFEKHYSKMLDLPRVEIRPIFRYMKFSEYAKKVEMDYVKDSELERCKLDREIELREIEDRLKEIENSMKKS